MIKADIVKKMADELSKENSQFKDRDALQVVDNIIEAMKDVIIRNKRLEIRDFGVFQIKQRKARVGRNPKNKKPYPIPEHAVVTFKPGKEIKELSQITPEDGDEDVE